MIMSIVNWIQSHFIVALAIFNIVMGALAKIFTQLQTKEPQWMQTAGDWGLKFTQWISGNTPTPGTVMQDQQK